MELLRISIENILFRLSELFTYLNKVILLLGQRGSDITEDALYILKPRTRTEYFPSMVNSNECYTVIELLHDWEGNSVHTGPTTGRINNRRTEYPPC